MFFDKILTKIFGTANERLLKRLRPIVIEISAMEPDVKKLSDEELKAKTVEFRARIAARLDGITDADEKKAAEKQILDEILPGRLSLWCARRAGARCRCGTSTCS